MKSINFQEKTLTSGTALVTGGAVRVGQAITRALAQAGFGVAVHYCRSHGPSEQLSDELSASGIQNTFIQADLTRPGAPIQMVEQVMETMGQLDLLVNNAAVLVNDTGSMVDLARMKLLNVDAPAACIKAAMPYLERSSGSVVNIADTAGITPFEQHKAYSRTQAALIELTEKNALESAQSGVRVNAVCPGTVLPPSDYGPDRVARLAAAIPMGSIGRPEDVADAVLYLACARFVTGQILLVDGGHVLKTKKKTR